MSAVSPERVQREIQNRFNPIRGLTPELLSRQLEQFKVGYLRQLALTWEAMENRDLHLKNVAMKRKKAVARHGWEVVAVDDSAEAQQQKEALEVFYENLRVTSVMEQDQQGGVSLLVRQMMDAVGKKYAVHEIVWKPMDATRSALIAQRKDKKKRTASAALARTTRRQEERNAAAQDSGTGLDAAARTASNFLTAEFRFCPLWFFENRTGQLRFLESAFAIDGVEMRAQDWLVSVGDGIMEGCSVAYMFKHLSLKDWVAFSEKFGMPGVLGKTASKKGSVEWDAMAEAVKNFANDWSAVCSAGETIEAVELKGGGQNMPQPPLVEYCDKRVAAAWRGADLSTISGTGPDSTGASLQEKEESLLQEDDAQWISETLNNRVDCHVIRYLFGTSECLAYVKINGADTASMDFRRQAWMGFLTDGTVNDILANQVSLKVLTEQVGLPVNEEYEDPYVPVEDAQGQAVTGDVVRDGEGDIIGAKPVAGQDGNDQNPNGRGGLNGRGRSATAATLENEAPTETEFLARAKAMLAAALADDLKPVRERLARILEIKDPDHMNARLASLLAELPQLTKDIGADPESARVFEQVSTASIFNGMEEGKMREGGKGK